MSSDYTRSPFRNWLITPLLLLSFLTIFSHTSSAQEGTRMVAMPSVTDDAVVFTYDNDLWIAGREGGTARRLTSADGREINPQFSPDGSLIAFSAEYDGQMDVYVMPSEGGPATRLTWHPGSDIVHGFTPDGSAVLFESPRSVYTTRYKHLYTVSVDGGVPERLPVPTGYKAALSPDGNYLAYTPLPEAFNQWKNYRGGRISRIWILDLDDLSVTEIPKPEGGSNDTDPMWIGDKVYFNSDRDISFNIYSFDMETGSVERITNLSDFPVLEPDAHSNGQIVFEHAGYLHEVYVNSGEVSQIPVSVQSDLKQTRERFVSGSRWVRNAAPSPDMNRIAFEYRGEIVTVPAEKGDPRNLTSGSGTHNRSPEWS
ncbi:MAG: peptidase S41, partial [Bacteroidetes bacterium]|nr:peptidase S41 [Bacteroidota bacterium]